MRLLRRLGGVVTGGLVVLAAFVVGAAFIAGRSGFPGPGGETVVWHAGMSVIAVTVQACADRRRGFAAFSGYVVVFIIAGHLLWTQWWN